MKRNTRTKHTNKKRTNKQTEKIISTLIIIIFIIASLILNKQENNNAESQSNETTTNYNLSNIPEYTDKIYTEINNNKEKHPKTLCFRVFFFIVRGESSVILISPIGNLYGAIQSCYLNTFHVQSDSQTVLPVCLGTKSCLRTTGRHGR